MTPPVLNAFGTLDAQRIPPNMVETAMGRYVDPFHLQMNDIDIGTIAHALSQQCRFRGHCKTFYSNAEHCCGVYDMGLRVLGDQANRDVMLELLLHDAWEVYWVDFATPVKSDPRLAWLLEHEERFHENVIRRRLGYAPDPKAIELRRLIDETVTFWEADALMPSRGLHWNWSASMQSFRERDPHVTYHHVEKWCFEQARFEFLIRFMKWN